MSWGRFVTARLRGLFTHARLERELDDEVRFHVDMQIEDNVKAGMSPTEARYAALRSFGGIEPMKERHRERRVFASVETIAQDVRYAARTLRKNPAFTATAAATLALAIGASTVMFSVVNAVLLRPLPYRSPEQLTMLWTGTGPEARGRPSFVTADAWRRQSQSFADMAVLDPVAATLTERDGVERIGGARISPNFFPLLGVPPLHGRGFTVEDAEQRRRVAMIGYRFWQTRFGGSRDAIGASIVLDGRPSEIIGIMPEAPGVFGLGADVWEPHTLFPDWEVLRATPNTGSWFVIGRLRPGVTVDQAQAEMSAIAHTLDAELPAADRNRGVSVVPLGLFVVGSRSRLALWMLTGAVLCVLLIAAANVASLSLARSTGRAREMATRAALGASPLRIVRQLLAESATLAVVSGVLGSGLAAAGIRLVRVFGPADLPRLNQATLDVRVLGWALAMSLLIGVLVGFAPAIMMCRRDSRPSGEEGGRSVSGGRATRSIRRALVVAEFALAIVLMAGAGLLIRSWWRVEAVDPGFRPERVLSMQLATPAVMASAQRGTFYTAVLEQVASLPGVESAALVGDLFVSSDAQRIVTTDGSGGLTSERVRLRVDEASERLFTTIGTPLLRGRFFSDEDGPDAPHVAIVNETMARRVWPGRDPLGARFKFGPRDSKAPWFTVVGVVGDMRRQGLEIDAIPQIFEPLAQNPSRLETLLVRTSANDPITMAASVQAAVRRVDKLTVVYGPNTLDNRLAAYLTQRRFQTSLLIAFSIVALLMAAIGIYGLIHYSVAARTREIGIRMAIGAQAGDIFRMTIREGLQLSVLGLVLGLMGALLAGRAGSSLLFGVTATDPVTFTATSLLLIAVAAAACYFPARRAMKVEPIAALRHS